MVDGEHFLIKPACCLGWFSSSVFPSQAGLTIFNTIAIYGTPHMTADKKLFAYRESTNTILSANGLYEIFVYYVLEYINTTSMRTIS